MWLDLAHGWVVVVWAVPDLGNACQELLIVRTICHNKRRFGEDNNNCIPESLAATVTSAASSLSVS